MPDRTLPVTFIDLMKPWHVQALARLSPDDPEVARVFVIAYAKHLKDGGTSANFIHQGIPLGPLAFRALETFIANTDISIPDEELQPGIDKILAITIDPETEAAKPPQGRELRIRELPEGAGRPNLAWIIDDGVGPLAAYASEEEAIEALPVFQEMIDAMIARDQEAYEAQTDPNTRPEPSDAAQTKPDERVG